MLFTRRESCADEKLLFFFEGGNVAEGSVQSSQADAVVFLIKNRVKRANEPIAEQIIFLVVD